ncbi:unnamed protein product [Caenorhabditis sp. 36 PRJEB53466]|nr:unnamed protein product [Caenorhabditis sp. 36 PRJEB53466]
MYEYCRHPQRKLPEMKVSFMTSAVIVMMEDVTTESVEGSKVFAKPHFDTAKLALRDFNVPGRRHVIRKAKQYGVQKTDWD